MGELSNYDLSAGWLVPLAIALLLGVAWVANQCRIKHARRAALARSAEGE